MNVVVPLPVIPWRAALAPTCHWPTGSFALSRKLQTAVPVASVAAVPLSVLPLGVVTVKVTLVPETGVCPALTLAVTLTCVGLE